MNFLDAGFPVALLEMNAGALDEGVAAIRANYESAVRQGQV